MASESAETELKKKTIGILQPGYLPWMGFFEQLHRCDVFVIYDDVQFDKGGWRNRNKIKGVDGRPMWITVPVLLKGQGMPLVRDVKINNEIPWFKKHLKTIYQYYSKARYFQEYADGFSALLHRERTFLVDIDLDTIFWMKDQLGIKTQMVLSSDLNIQGPREERLIALVKALQGTHFYEGKAGMNYIDTNLFEQEGISVIFQDYSHPVYPQLHGEFISHLSTLDLLLNCGPDSLQILVNGERQS